MKILFYSELKLQASELQNSDLNLAIMEKPDQFQVYDLVWRHVQLRARKKEDDTYTGPHRIIQKLGDYTYVINSHTAKSVLMKVNAADIKTFTIPNTSNWKLNPEVLIMAFQQFGFPMPTNLKIVIDFQHLKELTLEMLLSSMMFLSSFLTGLVQLGSQL